jgi:hypothetical protein
VWLQFQTWSSKILYVARATLISPVCQINCTGRFRRSQRMYEVQAHPQTKNEQNFWGAARTKWYIQLTSSISTRNCQCVLIIGLLHKLIAMDANDTENSRLTISTPFYGVHFSWHLFGGDSKRTSQQDRFSVYWLENDTLKHAFQMIVNRVCCRGIINR